MLLAGCFCSHNREQSLALKKPAWNMQTWPLDKMKTDLIRWSQHFRDNFTKVARCLVFQQGELLFWTCTFFLLCVVPASCCWAAIQGWQPLKDSVPSLPGVRCKEQPFNSGDYGVWLECWLEYIFVCVCFAAIGKLESALPSSSDLNIYMCYLYRAVVPKIIPQLC